MCRPSQPLLRRTGRVLSSACLPQEARDSVSLSRTSAAVGARSENQGSAGALIPRHHRAGTRTWGCVGTTHLQVTAFHTYPQHVARGSACPGVPLLNPRVTTCGNGQGFHHRAADLGASDPGAPEVPGQTKAPQPAPASRLRLRVHCDPDAPSTIASARPFKWVLQLHDLMLDSPRHLSVQFFREAPPAALLIRSRYSRAVRVVCGVRRRGSPGNHWTGHPS